MRVNLKKFINFTTQFI